MRKERTRSGYALFILKKLKNDTSLHIFFRRPAWDNRGGGSPCRPYNLLHLGGIPFAPRVICSDKTTNMRHRCPVRGDHSK
nr:MAG TPA: hypothetical protein [Caudoviricetes sp.]